MDLDTKILAVNILLSLSLVGMMFAVYFLIFSKLKQHLDVAAFFACLSLISFFMTMAVVDCGSLSCSYYDEKENDPQFIYEENFLG